MRTAILPRRGGGGHQWTAVLPSFEPIATKGRKGSYCFSPLNSTVCPSSCGTTSSWGRVCSYRALKIWGVFVQLAELTMRYQVSELHLGILYSSQQLMFFYIQRHLPISTEHNYNIHYCTHPQHN